ncbi:hypothetical protein [Asanoa ferruginea]|uniref:hypothetical protein n=1 Tax=Asanoa ferruginea TaxID=53367 RepID=UPI000E229EE8|nr:hypothetical protein [Asanoa ferruginea]
MLGAGAAATIGSFLPWASVTAPLIGTVSASGVDGTDGWVTAALGLALVAFGTLTLRRHRMPSAVPVLALLAALALLALGVWKIADLSSAEEDMRQQMATPSEDDVFGIGASMSQAVQMKVGIGLWLIMLAGLAGSVATIVMLMTGRRAARVA